MGSFEPSLSMDIRSVVVRYARPHASSVGLEKSELRREIDRYRGGVLHNVMFREMSPVVF